MRIRRRLHLPRRAVVLLGQRHLDAVRVEDSPTIVQSVAEVHDTSIGRTCCAPAGPRDGLKRPAVSVPALGESDETDRCSTASSNRRPRSSTARRTRPHQALTERAGGERDLLDRPLLAVPALNHSLHVAAVVDEVPDPDARTRRGARDRDQLGANGRSPDRAASGAPSCGRSSARRGRESPVVRPLYAPTAMHQLFRRAGHPREGCYGLRRRRLESAGWPTSCRSNAPRARPSPLMSWCIGRSRCSGCSKSRTRRTAGWTWRRPESPRAEPTSASPVESLGDRALARPPRGADTPTANTTEQTRRTRPRAVHCEDRRRARLNRPVQAGREREHTDLPEELIATWC